MTMLLVFLAAATVQAAPQRMDDRTLVCRYEANRMGMALRVCQTKATREDKAWENAKWLRDLQQRRTQTRN